MFTALIVIGIIASILLILIVLAQNPKGGLNSQMGASSNTLGVKNTTNFLEKATWGLAIAVFVICIFASRFLTPNIEVDTNNDVDTETSIDEGEDLDADLDD